MFKCSDGKGYMWVGRRIGGPVADSGEDLTRLICGVKWRKIKRTSELMLMVELTKHCEIGEAVKKM